MSTHNHVEPSTLRITNQFRSRDGMVYDMRQHGAHLTVVVTPRMSEQDSGEWRVRARTGNADGESIEEWGPTRLDALRAVGRAWTEKGSSGLPQFDWEAIVTQLLAVRAL
jgi:hypothetical protein